METAEQRASVCAAADALCDTLRTAEALVRTDRRIDLAGLDEQVRTLCARAAALPREQAGAAVEGLRALMARTESLLAAFTPPGR